MTPPSASSGLKRRVRLRKLQTSPHADTDPMPLPPTADLVDRLTAELATLRHPLVRDLAWLLHAPDMLATAFAGRPSLAELGLADPERRHGWLSRLERDPQAIEAVVGPSLASRLGLYHEALWHFLLAHAPNTRLLAHNLPVRDARRTLGEIDLLYATRDDPRPIHLELAIKYYLGLPKGPGAPHSQARWIGPGCADSLAIKRQRAVHHQLPLAARPEAAATLARFGAPPLTQRLAILGILFRPWRPDAVALPPPREVAAQAEFGDWLPLADWDAFHDSLEACASVRGALLDKPHWLAPPPDDGLLDSTALGRALGHHFANRRTPRQLAIRQADGHWRRLFVVGDGWPHTIPFVHWQTAPA